MANTLYRTGNSLRMSMVIAMKHPEYGLILGDGLGIITSEDGSRRRIESHKVRKINPSLALFFTGNSGDDIYLHLDNLTRELKPVTKLNTALKIMMERLGEVLTPSPLTDVKIGLYGYNKGRLFIKSVHFRHDQPPVLCEYNQEMYLQGEGVITEYVSRRSDEMAWELSTVTEQATGLMSEAIAQFPEYIDHPIDIVKIVQPRIK